MSVAKKKEKKETVVEEKIYWSESEKLRMSGLEPEERTPYSLKPDKALRFHGHIYRTNVLEIQEFIESSSLFNRNNGVRIITEKELVALKQKNVEEKKKALTAMQEAGKI
jgi:hypothetical protein